MPFFRKTTEITKLLDRFAHGQTDIDAAEFVQLSKLIEDQGDTGIQEAGKTLKNLLKNGDLKTQSKTIDLVRLVIDNGGSNNQRILDDGIGLSAQILKVANKGESRPRAKAREFLKSRDKNPLLAPLSSQVSPSPISEPESRAVRDAERVNLSQYRHDYPDLNTQPGNLENLLPKHRRVHYDPLHEEDVDNIPKLTAVGNSLLDRLNEASPTNKISPVLLDNSQLVRDRLVNLFHSERTDNGNIPDSLFKLNDQLQQSIEFASRYADV